MQGLGQGLGTEEKPVMARVGKIAERLKQAGAGMALGAAVALPAGAAAGAPLAARPPTTGPAAQAAAGPITITVNAAPGMDELKVAELVAQKLEQAQRQQLTRARSRLFDDD